MAEWGVFAVSRSIWDHPIFEDEPFTQREAWMWLISAAAWKPIKIGHCGQVISLGRGEFLFSVRFLADKFGWSKSRIGRFLERLEKQDMIRDAERDACKVYSIINYNEYQCVGLPDRDSSRDDVRDTSGTRAGHERDKEETLQPLQTSEVSISAVPASKPIRRNSLNGHKEDFLAFYEAFPKHEKRGDAQKAYAGALARASPADILAGAIRYAAKRSGQDQQYTQGPGAWLRADRWLDEAPKTASTLDPLIARARALEENDERRT